MRKGVVLLLVLAAGALHWAALRGIGQMLGAESVGHQAVGADVPPVRLVARETPTPRRMATNARPDAPAARAARMPPARAPARPPARPQPVKPPSPQPMAAPGTSTQAPADSDPGTSEAYRFYTAREVDVTAEPVSHWNLEPSALDSLAVSRIVFTLFVGRDGSVLHCSVDEPERLKPEQRRALAALLADTRMRPARRAGVAVPSRRRVELFTVGGI